MNITSLIEKLQRVAAEAGPNALVMLMIDDLPHNLSTLVFDLHDDADGSSTIWIYGEEA